MIVGTAGHIDHGKTSLVRALTGVDTDRLGEEKARGISIELGYAYVPLDNGDVLGFIDVPGHEKLVHKMAAGASGIDMMLLVIAADDGIMPQTSEHVSIARLLGIDRAVVALTKVDRVEPQRALAVREAVGEWLTGTVFAHAPMFETNALRDGDPGVAALDRLLRDEARVWRSRRDDAYFRLAVDRVFTLAGAGTIVTGTAVAGRVNVGDVLCLAPRGIPVRVRAIHAQNRPAQTGRAGERCALNLAGVGKDDVERGDWIVDERLAQASERLDVQWQWLIEADAVYRPGMPVHVHLGAMHRVARVFPIDARSNPVRMQLVFDTPVCTLPGDRFIARNAQATRTIGGGRVLDPFGPARKRASVERKAWLDALAAWLDTGRIERLIEQAPHGIGSRMLECLSGAGTGALQFDDEVIRLVPKRASQGVMFFIHRLRWEALRARVIATLDALHRQAPDELGPDAPRLRRVAAPLADDTLWTLLIDAMLADGELTRSGPWLHLPTHAVSLTDSDHRLAARLVPHLRERGCNATWVRDLAADASLAEEDARALLMKLARAAQVYRVVPDLFLSREAVMTLAALIMRLAQDGGGVLTAASFRDATGFGRKRAIQVLEFFDRLHFTRFHRGVRMLRADSRLLAEDRRIKAGHDEHDEHEAGIR